MLLADRLIQFEAHQLVHNSADLVHDSDHFNYVRKLMTCLSHTGYPVSFYNYTVSLLIAQLRYFLQEPFIIRDWGFVESIELKIR